MFKSLVQFIKNLLQCAKNGNIDELAELMTENPDILLVNDNNEATCFHFAAMHGNCNILESVFNFSPAIGKERKFWLFFCYHKECLDKKNLMLTIFLVLESKNIFDETPLHWAALYDQGDVVTMLLEKGAKHNSLNSKGLSPIHVAVFRGSLKALKSIIASKVIHIYKIPLKFIA